ncbi:uncharacterized protein TNCV_2918401 [Trichonephila clavipes]|nr:uncharacterized protein TNCV_2918401 [Trichonephila clavipes]
MWEIISPDDLDPDNGTKLLNYCNCYRSGTTCGTHENPGWVLYEKCCGGRCCPFRTNQMKVSVFPRTSSSKVKWVLFQQDLAVGNFKKKSDGAKSVFEDILRLFHGAHDSTLESRSFLIHLESSSDTEEKPTRESSRVQHLLAEWENKIPDDFKFNFFDGDSWEELWNGDAPTQAGETNQEGSFDSLGNRLKQLLSSVFEDYEEEQKYFAKFAGKGISWQLRNELLHQQTEIRNHLQTFRDRPDLLSSLMNYITGPQNHPLVVRGRQGRGKSALLAVASVLCGAVFPTMPVLFRSAGVSPESFTQEQILRSICEQLATLYGEHPSVASRVSGHNY